MENNVYKSPESDLQVDQEGEYVLANRLTRLWASLIDMLTFAPVVIVVMYITGGFDGISEGVEPSFFYMMTISLLSCAIFLAIHGKLMVSNGQTWGKKFLGIKMVTMEDQTVSIAGLAKRYGFYWLIGLVPVIGSLASLVNILFIFAKSKRCIHDFIGNTKVVKVK